MHATISRFTPADHAEVLCLGFLVLTIALLLFAEFNRTTRSSRAAAVTAILTILVADYFFIIAIRDGSAWIFPAPAASQRAVARSGWSTGTRGEGAMARRGGADSDRGAEGVESDRGGSGRDGGSGSKVAESGHRDNATGSDAADDLARSAAQWLRAHLGRKTEPRSLNDITTFKDCPICPEMVRIAPGEMQIIGAAAPIDAPRTMRVWPGFAISRTEITAGALVEAGISLGSGETCTAPAIRVDEGAGVPATCLTTADAERYLDWLRYRTGRRYRLPNAAEWEFAARANAERELGISGLPGNVAELTGECWNSITPLQVMAGAQTRPGLSPCAFRVVKDGSQDEPALWRSPTAARLIRDHHRSPRIGFRILRDFDLTAAKGF